MRLIAFALLSACAFGVAAQDLSSQRDYTDNAQRDRPIACKPGDIESHPGKTVGELFGAEWPAQPVAASPDARSQPSIVERMRIRWPRGMDPQDSILVMAVLVGADGKPLRAEPVCSTRMGLDAAVRRSLMESTYAPALVDGKPVTSVLMVVQRINAVERHAPAKPRRR